MNKVQFLVLASTNLANYADSNSEINYPDFCDLLFHTNFVFWKKTPVCLTSNTWTWRRGARNRSVGPRKQWAVFNDRLAQQQLPWGTILRQTQSVSALKICIGSGGKKTKPKARLVPVSRCQAFCPFSACWGHIGSRWSSRSSASSSRGSAGTSRYAEASSRLRERHTKSQPSWKK